MPSLLDFCLQNYKQSIKQAMILNPSDPSGLFSKCARNHASKTKGARPSTAKIQKAEKRAITEEKKDAKSKSDFGKKQSREQRQMRYKKDEVPSVGQYNIYEKCKPKLVWDILKIYQRQLNKRKSNSNSKQNKTASDEITITQPQIQETIINEPINSKMVTLEDQALTKSQCLVNMSRMTGRQEKMNESVDWGNENIMKSISYIKGNTSKNIYFAKQKNKQKDYRTINPASSYLYDYTIVKPSRKGIVGFSTLRGRQSTKQRHQYSYQHYQYNNYVWQSNSKVYPNTKTHLIDFKKQIDRYKRKNPSQMSEA